MKILGIAGLFLLTVSGCTKNDETAADTVFPVITLNSPVNGQNFAAGQPIPISGTIPITIILPKYIYMSAISVPAAC